LDFKDAANRENVKEIVFYVCIHVHHFHSMCSHRSVAPSVVLIERTQRARIFTEINELRLDVLTEALLPPWVSVSRVKRV